MTSRPRSELWVVLLIAAVQFVNILDFVMVMPMGPTFAKALAIDTGQLGLIAGSYTAAGCISGLIGSLFLDRFDRRTALAVAMLGLVTGTAMGGVSTGLNSLMISRVVAGAFGGPATSLSLSIIADVVPPERRGKAMGMVFSAFSIAQTLGVPAGLWAAGRFGWRAPFLSVAAMGLVVAGVGTFLLPPMRGHLLAVKSRGWDAYGFVRRPEVILSYVMTATTMAGGFIIIPNIAGYVQINLAFPFEDLIYAYFFGGVVSFVAMNLVGRLVDRYGSLKVGTFGTVLLAAVLYFAFVRYSIASGLELLPHTHAVIYGVFAGFMLSMAFRNIAYNTLTSKVPGPAERAAFMSLQSAVQAGASSLGAFMSSKLLTTLPDQRMDGIPRIAWVSIALSLTLPLLFWAVERQVRARPPSTVPPAGEPLPVAAAAPH